MSPVKAERVLAGLIAVCLALLAWVVIGMFREKVVLAGDTAPDFSIRTETGQTITPSNFGGKLLVLHFWATWCPPCVVEIPSLNQFQKQFASDGVVVLGVSVDQNAKAYSDFLKRFNVTFQTARDPEARISAEYGTFQYPETYIINREGKVVEKVISNTDWNDPERLTVIRSLLNS
jgi:cytochrome c biogenesis protein CcmG, thiol:disulfide interchange protein DsbE